MLKSAHDTGTAERPEIRQLFERLKADGQRWAQSEVDLARIELSELKGRVIRVAAFGVLAFAAAFSALVVLSQAGVAFLTPYVDGVAVAALIVGVILLVIVALSALAVRSAFSWQGESVFLKWFSRRTGAGEPPR